jgi:hypothetical protein
MSDFEEYCREYLTTPDAHLAISQDESDLVDQPKGDKVAVGKSKIHGKGVFPLDWFEAGQEIGLLTDMYFHRTRVIGRFINHSSNPSAHMVPLYGRGMMLLASRPILLEDEITIDYHDVEILRKILRDENLA